MNQFNLNNMMKRLDQKLNLTTQERDNIQASINQNIEQKNRKSNRRFNSIPLAVAASLFLILAVPAVTPFLERNQTSQLLQAEEVETMVNSYLEALVTKNIEALVHYSDDLRFPDKEEQLAQYVTIDNTITHASMKELTKVNEREYAVTIRFIDEREPRPFEQTFSVRFQKGKGWKIIVGEDLPSS
ncbi:hypothetical protein M3212_04865 [Alkalihalobacillus oceani]|uniref:hypothetical protein n=1 Tax=Halalkalibacter oceani TaxID=1653776 RepID=UPI00203AA6A6|nr:hypothetical protein [Halalkalibacter oceani]MCM3760120.1 hypothetical protein [Halalkalibacter oceani]